jgi:hypothetical protein
MEWATYFVFFAEDRISRQGVRKRLSWKRLRAVAEKIRSEFYSGSFNMSSRGDLEIFWVNRTEHSLHSLEVIALSLELLKQAIKKRVTLSNTRQ